MNALLKALGFVEIGHREDECRSCFYIGCVITYAFDDEGNAFSKMGTFDLTNFGFRKIELSSPFAAPAAA